MAAELAPMWSRLGSLILESGRRDRGSRIYAEQNLNERVIARLVTLAPVSHTGQLQLFRSNSCFCRTARTHCSSRAERPAQMQLQYEAV